MRRERAVVARVPWGRVNLSLILNAGSGPRPGQRSRSDLLRFRNEHLWFIIVGVPSVQSCEFTQAGKTGKLSQSLRVVPDVRSGAEFRGARKGAKAQRI